MKEGLAFAYFLLMHFVLVRAPLPELSASWSPAAALSGRLHSGKINCCVAVLVWFGCWFTSQTVCKSSVATKSTTRVPDFEADECKSNRPL